MVAWKQLHATSSVLTHDAKRIHLDQGDPSSECLHLFLCFRESVRLYRLRLDALLYAHLLLMLCPVHSICFSLGPHTLARSQRLPLLAQRLLVRRPLSRGCVRLKSLSCSICSRLSPAAVCSSWVFFSRPVMVCCNIRPGPRCSGSRRSSC